MSKTGLRERRINNLIDSEAKSALYSHEEIFQICTDAVILRESSGLSPERFRTEVLPQFFEDFKKKKAEAYRDQLIKFWEKADKEREEKREEFKKENWIFDDEVFVRILPEQWVYLEISDWPTEERFLKTAVSEAWNTDETTNEGYLAMKRLFFTLVLPDGKSLDDFEQSELYELVKQRFQKWKNSLQKDETNS